jgi:hypothetical protein
MGIGGLDKIKALQESSRSLYEEERVELLLEQALIIIYLKPTPVDVAKQNTTTKTKKIIQKNMLQ